MSDYFAARDKRRAIDAAEAAGQVADSMEVRESLLALVRSGEIDLDECQRRLAVIKRAVKKNGLLTRSQVWRQS